MHRLQASTNMINKNKTKDQLPRLGKRELICLLLFSCNLCGFCSARFPLPLRTGDGLRYLIVALPEPSI